ncbi:MAG TPA: hypothetical protein PK079_04220 [Leptospiraceae bacterium]|nr:hypothetical protein [Leptospiraceae bacterium]HMW05443.1 hypothetical protein [Leptospiraceae bacterium]HMX31408.1 hypothetical protein [Leptospiraceae bacterium]HMY30953.1 hypothetical protein [Leptospiraceae bacterium]HMZ63364.1 hypothetical protein [Leptospiraceae bacterium]
MEQKKSKFMSLIERITTKAEKLDQLCNIIPQELDYKRHERSKWNSWHSEWKKAWIDSSESYLSDEEREAKRLETSITTRYRTVD